MRYTLSPTAATAAAAYCDHRCPPPPPPLSAITHSTRSQISVRKKGGVFDYGGTPMQGWCYIWRRLYQGLGVRALGNRPKFGWGGTIFKGYTTLSGGASSHSL
eukprot:750587-Hanusia_phi.AAC.1